MIKSRFAAALAAGVLAVPMAASAAVVTQLIHFDDANNGWKWYSTADRNFLFDPTNLQSSTQCADSTNGGNGSCVIEGTQGVLPLMTRPTTGTTLQGSASSNPDPSGPNLSFTLDSFYFLLTGNGTGSSNAITVTGGTGQTPGLSVVHTYTFALGTNWDGAPAPDVTFYEGANAGSAAGNLVKDTGYIASFSTLFQNVTWIQFSAPTTAEVRLDCVVATFDGSTTEPLKPGTTCGIGGSNGTSGASGANGTVPAPGSGSLVLVALGLMGAAFWKRKAGAAQA
ncbi:MAG TPA: hypothetical protein PLB41_13205 [Rubrivivax sp.]|nr:hypothetical protein [Rubrivivax sp.]HPO18172.1 hypothetical protein [Rubrivivax sp.]